MLNILQEPDHGSWILDLDHIRSNRYLTAICDDDALQIENNTVQIGEVDPDGDFTAELVMSADFDIIGGSIFHLDISLHTGEYSTT